MIMNFLNLAYTLIRDFFTLSAPKIEMWNIYVSVLFKMKAIDPFNLTKCLSTKNLLNNHLI